MPNVYFCLTIFSLLSLPKDNATWSVDCTTGVCLCLFIVKYHYSSFFTITVLSVSYQFLVKNKVYNNSRPTEL